MIDRRPRLASALVAALVLVTLLGGCSGSDQAGGGEKSSSSTGSAGSSASEGSKGGGASPATPAPPPPLPRAGMPKVGQCFQVSARQTRAAVFTGRRVACRAPHTSVVAYAGLVRGAITAQTPIQRRRAVARRLCTPAFARVAGGTPADRATSLLTWVFFTPSAAELERGARWVRCDVIARSGDVLVPLSTEPPLLGAGVPEDLRVCQTSTGVDVSCSRKHAFRVEAVYREEAPTYPAAQTYTQTARDRCQVLMQGYGGYWQPPSRAGWVAGDRFIRCLRQDPPPTTTG